MHMLSLLSWYFYVSNILMIPLFNVIVSLLCSLWINFVIFLWFYSFVFIFLCFKYLVDPILRLKISEHSHLAQLFCSWCGATHHLHGQPTTRLVSQFLPDSPRAVYPPVLCSPCVDFLTTVQHCTAVIDPVRTNAYLTEKSLPSHL